MVANQMHTLRVRVRGLSRGYIRGVLSALAVVPADWSGVRGLVLGGLHIDIARGSAHIECTAGRDVPDEPTARLVRQWSSTTMDELDGAFTPEGFSTAWGARYAGLDAGYERLLVGSARWMIDARQERALHKSYILDVLDVFDVVPVPAQEFSTTFESLLRAAHLRHEEDGGPDGSAVGPRMVLLGRAGTVALDHFECSELDGRYAPDQLRERVGSRAEGYRKRWQTILAYASDAAAGEGIADAPAGRITFDDVSDEQARRRLQGRLGR
ncbi:Hypothetical protein PFR_JS9-2_2245 [Propionibacterium freudenreichii]|nr:Hypothetical protein PFR_JS9-1_2249 [Propionibacterium freudenreichii]SCQ71218.1 Hypothetical protein PFR_JS9-2_2245 [Propionibacterium freudenreichii]